MKRAIGAMIACSNDVTIFEACFVNSIPEDGAHANLLEFEHPFGRNRGQKTKKKAILPTFVIILFSAF